MTKKEFIQYLKRRDKIANTYNYALLIAIAGVGIYGLYQSLFENIFAQQPVYTWAISIVSVLLIAVSLWGLWKVNAIYQPIELKTKKSSAEIKDYIEQYLSTKRNVIRTTDKVANGYYYMNKYFTRFTILFKKVEADNKLYVFVENADARSNDYKGILDFGLASRARKKLTRYLEPVL